MQDITFFLFERCFVNATRVNTIECVKAAHRHTITIAKRTNHIA
jgi:hypothetical protein